jgi:DNA-binding CsgD family transcriptional regulator
VDASRVDAAVAQAAVAAGLTAREAEVLSALARGATASQVARELQISPRTVHKHLEHVYRKLGVTHGGAAMARVTRGG